MREEYQKTIILLSIMLIFGGVYVSTFFDRGSMRHNNTILFSILVAVVMIGYMQTYKIKRWKEEEKTDYRLVYWSYMGLTFALFLYLIFMVVTRSEKNCMRNLRYLISDGFIKLRYIRNQSLNNKNKNKKKNFKGGSHISNEATVDSSTQIDESGGMEVGLAEGISEDGGSGEVESSKFSISNLSNKQILERLTVSGAMSKLFKGYKKVWKKMLFIRD